MRGFYLHELPGRINPGIEITTLAGVRMARAPGFKHEYQMQARTAGLQGNPNNP